MNKTITTALCLIALSGCKLTSIENTLLKEKVPIYETKTEDRDGYLRQVHAYQKHPYTNERRSLHINARCDSVDGMEFSIYSEILHNRNSYNDKTWMFETSSSSGVLEPEIEVPVGRKNRFTYSLSDFESLAKNYDQTDNSIFRIKAPRKEFLDLIEQCTKSAMEVETKKAESQMKIEVTAKALKANPMYGGDNIQTFLGINRELMLNGKEHLKGDFVWINDAGYTVRKVEKVNIKEGYKLVLLEINSYQLDSLPVLIFTKKSPIKGQIWPRVSQEPLIFIDVDSIDRDMALKHQLFDEQYMIFMEAE